MADFTKFLKGNKGSGEVANTGGLPSVKPQGTAVGDILKNVRPAEIDTTARTRYLTAADQGAAAGFSTQRKGRFAILLDATGSMNNLLDAARRSLGDIIARIQSEGQIEAAVQIIVYRDYEDGDELLVISSEETKAQPLVSWLDRIAAKGGHDTPEAIEAALARVLDLGEFNAVLLAGDSPSHTRDNLARKGKPQSKTAHDLALEFGQKRVPIHTFVVGNSEETVADFATIAKNSGGQTGRLDGSDAMRDMAVMAMLDRLKGKGAVKAYMERHGLLSGNAAAFGNALLLEHKR